MHTNQLWSSVMKFRFLLLTITLFTDFFKNNSVVNVSFWLIVVLKEHVVLRTISGSGMHSNFVILTEYSFWKYQIEKFIPIWTYIFFNFVPCWLHPIDTEAWYTRSEIVYACLGEVVLESQYRLTMMNEYFCFIRIHTIWVNSEYICNSDRVGYTCQLC